MTRELTIESYGVRDLKPGFVSKEGHWFIDDDWGLPPFEDDSGLISKDDAWD